MKVPKTVKKKMLYYMKLTRSLEDRIERKLYRQGKIVGGVYVGRGQEAISVGSAMVMEDNDVTAPTHRDMGVFLIRGFTVREIIAQYMGRKTGITEGKEGNMHMGDLTRNVLCFVSHLADNVPIAAGCAMAFKMKNEKRVAFCYSGDGATSRGDWHEGLNIAAVMKLPVVFFINNNQYAYSTPLEAQMPVKNVADRAPAYAMPSEVVDGNDVVAVYSAAKKAVALARDGKGPSLIECKTFRMTGHSAHDDAGYVPKGLFEEWQKKDPIEKLQNDLFGDKSISEAEIKKMEEEIEAIIDEAAEWADNSPYPEPEDTIKGVYFEE